MRFHDSIRRLLPVLLVLAATFQAQAAVQVRALSQSQTSGNGVQDPQYDRDDTGLLTVGPGGFAYEDTHVVSTQPAQIRAEADSWINTRPGEFKSHLHVDAHSGPGGGYVAAQAYTFGEWHDDITITSGSLTNGTNVQLTLTIVVDYDVAVGSGTTWSIQVYMPQLQYNSSNYSVNPSDTATGTMSATVGNTFNLYQTLNANLASETVINGQSDAGTLDIGNTVHLYLSSSSDVTITSASGATYAPATETVPEPATLALWGLGGLALAAASRWRRRRL